MSYKRKQTDMKQMSSIRKQMRIHLYKSGVFFDNDKQRLVQFYRPRRFKGFRVAANRRFRRQSLEFSGKSGFKRAGDVSRDTW